MQYVPTQIRFMGTRFLCSACGKVKPLTGSSGGGPSRRPRICKGCIPEPAACKVPSCSQIGHKRGLCDKHYSRWLKHGTTVLQRRKKSA